MSTINAGIKAGFIGTVSLSAIMFVKDVMGMSVMLGWVMGRVFASQKVTDDSEPATV